MTKKEISEAIKLLPPTNECKNDTYCLPIKIITVDDDPATLVEYDLYFKKDYSNGTPIWKFYRKNQYRFISK